MKANHQIAENKVEKRTKLSNPNLLFSYYSDSDLICNKFGIIWHVDTTSSKETKHNVRAIRNSPVVLIKVALSDQHREETRQKQT